MNTASSNVNNLLNKLEQALKSSKLWSVDAPLPEQLASVQPFCVDTLRFEQWLQFIFIPKMQELLAQQLPLPNQIALCPMAEEAFAPMGDAAADIVNVLGDIDEALSGQRMQQKFLHN
ncbi:YqcC family protein [Thalassotalea euphylliae]|uniref:YqcC family protein n=1 Tax=Thalassotalea euphylliae TaxID=1655234 RepID=UPI00363072F5